MPLLYVSSPAPGFSFAIVTPTLFLVWFTGCQLLLDCITGPRRRGSQHGTRHSTTAAYRTAPSAGCAPACRYRFCRGRLPSTSCASGFGCVLAEPPAAVSIRAPLLPLTRCLDCLTLDGFNRLPAAALSSAATAAAAPPVHYPLVHAAFTATLPPAHFRTARFLTLNAYAVWFRISKLTRS